MVVLSVLLDEGDCAWLEEPGYNGARSALIAAGARIVPVRVDDPGLDVAAAVKQSPDARLAYVTPSNQFPLGVPMSLSRRLALLKWARAVGHGSWKMTTTASSVTARAPCNRCTGSTQTDASFTWVR